MKRHLALALALLLIPACAGCGATGKTSAAGDYPLMLMVDGVLYRSTGEPAPAEVDESVIETVGPYTDAEPKEDGQQNFDRSCAAEYGVTSDGLMVMLDHEWVRFEPAEQPE